jgi:TetR/AcrR family transcriptional regulator, regulator of autoinduction and epiphytic fitness
VTEPVKRDSPNKSGRGQARTRLARRAVVESARTLFLERGYAATTIEAISEHSDVPSATVYRLFSSKLGILKAVLDTSIAGDDQPLAVQERPDVASLFSEPDPHKLLAGFAGITTAINQRTNDIYRVLVSAAGSDLAAAELLEEIRQERDRGQSRIARSLARAHALKPGLRERDAADLIHTLMAPEVYRLLVGDRGWTPERYQHWLATTLTQQLT